MRRRLKDAVFLVLKNTHQASQLVTKPLLFLQKIYIICIKYNYVQISGLMTLGSHRHEKSGENEYTAAAAEYCHAHYSTDLVCGDFDCLK